MWRSKLLTVTKQQIVASDETEPGKTWAQLWRTNMEAMALRVCAEFPLLGVFVAAADSVLEVIWNGGRSWVEIECSSVGFGDKCFVGIKYQPAVEPVGFVANSEIAILEWLKSVI